MLIFLFLGGCNLLRAVRNGPGFRCLAQSGRLLPPHPSPPPRPALLVACVLVVDVFLVFVRCQSNESGHRAATRPSVKSGEYLGETERSSANTASVWWSHPPAATSARTGGLSGLRMAGSVGTRHRLSVERRGTSARGHECSVAAMGRETRSRAKWLLFTYVLACTEHTG